MQNNEYISRFSHELRNPLTLIYSSMQLLEKECPAVCKSELWGQIRKDMLDVIQLLKRMSAPSDGMHLTSVSLANFLADLSASFAPSMEMHKICFVTELPDGLSGISIKADRQKLRQAISNLLLNAADAVSIYSAPERPVHAASASPAYADTVAPAHAGITSPVHAESADSVSDSSVPEPPAQGTVILSAVRDGADVCIHVRDNGPGIPQEYLRNLFEPFVTHKANGTGLGLNIVREIAEQHGGSISVDTCCGSQTAPGSSEARPHGDAETALLKSSDSKTPDSPAPAKSISYTDFCLRLPVCHSQDGQDDSS